MSHNAPAESLEVLAKEILDNTRSRSGSLREREAFAHAQHMTIEQVNADLKAHFEDLRKRLDALQGAPFMK